MLRKACAASAVLALLGGCGSPYLDAPGAATAGSSAIASKLREGKTGRDAVLARGIAVVPALREAFRNKDINADTRGQALICLAAIAREDAAGAIVEALLDEHWFLRNLAVMFVHRLDLTEAIPRMAAMSRDDDSPEVRGSCLYCLTQLGWRDPNAYLPSLADPHGTVRRGVVLSAFRLRSLPVLSGAVDHYRRQPPEAWTEVAYLVKMLSRIAGCPGDENAQAMLVWFSENEDFMTWARDAELPKLDFDAAVCGMDAWRWSFLSAERRQELLNDRLEDSHLSTEAWQSMEPNEKGDRIRKSRSGSKRR